MAKIFYAATCFVRFLDFMLRIVSFYIYLYIIQVLFVKVWNIYIYINHFEVQFLL